MKLNRTLNWGIGALLGTLIGNLIALLVFEKPWAEFFTSDWWSRWTAIYAVCLIFIVIGLIRGRQQAKR